MAPTHSDRWMNTCRLRVSNFTWLCAVQYAAAFDDAFTCSSKVHNLYSKRLFPLPVGMIC